MGAMRCGLLGKGTPRRSSSRTAWLMSCSNVLCPPDGACQADATMRGRLATRHAALDGFQHVVADIVAEFMYAFSPRLVQTRRSDVDLLRGVAGFPRSHDFIADIHCCIPRRVARIRICRGAPESEQGSE